MKTVTSMWKKIVYYAAMIVVGVLFLMAYGMVKIENTYSSMISKSINSDNYSNVLRLYTTFGNKNAVASTKVNDAKVSVFETADITTRTEGNKSYDYLDYGYSVFISNSAAKKNNQQFEDGTEYNKTGIRITSGDNSFTYYANTFEGGVIVDSDDASYEQKHGIYKDYNNLYVDTSSFKLLHYTIPYEFVQNNLGTNGFSKLEVLDASGSVYAKVESNFNYSSDFFTKIEEIKTSHNNASKADDMEEFNKSYDTWYDTYKEGGYLFKFSQKDVFGASFYIKLVLMGLAFILVVLIIGDILVGKRRIISFFSNLTSPKEPTRVVDAEARVINEDEKEE